MAAGTKRAKGSDEKPIRPLLLAGVLGLVWFVVAQEGGIDDTVPNWGVPIVMGARLLADFIGGWVVVSAVRLLFGLVRLGLAQLRARS